jgi:hypothetical protein
MKTHLFFKKADQPSQMGQSQKIDGGIDSPAMKQFISDRKDILVKAKISDDKKTLTFVKEVDSDGKEVIGTAYLSEHDDDFENA